MPERGTHTHTTLSVPRRCPWCGHRCQAVTCRYCADLERLAREATGRPLRDELRQAVRRR